MRIAVCDDDPQDMEQIVQCVQKYDSAIEPDRFSSAEALLSAYAAGYRCDIIFMDIQMDGMNGYNAAEVLKKNAPKGPPLIVFATVTKRYWQTGYAVARGYLTKPFIENEVTETLSRLMKELEPNLIRIEHGAETYIVNTDEIIYAEIKDNTLTIKLKNGDSVEKRIPMDQFCKLLPKDSFTQPHRSFIVACECVVSWDDRLVQMTDGKSIPISRSKRKEFDDGMNMYYRESR